MANNKVVYGNETIMDITDSTVDENSLLKGRTAYAANGEKITGVVPERVITDTTKEDFEQTVSEAKERDLIIVIDEDSEDNIGKQMPTLYEIINGKPEKFGGGGGTSNYNDLENKPQINGKTLQGNKTLSDLGIIIPASLSDLLEDANHRTVTDAEKTNWNNKSTFDGNYNSLSNKPTIPTSLSQLSNDSTHRTVTDAEKSAWNNKSSFSGNYNDLSNKPNIFGSAAAYSSSTSYTVGTFVTYNNTLYVCIKATQGNVPTNTTYWAKCDLTNIGGVRFGIDGDGNRGYYGADGSLIPFSSFKVVSKTLTLKTSDQEVNLGFRPTFIVGTTGYGRNSYCSKFRYENGVLTGSRKGASSSVEEPAVAITLTNTGLKIKAINSSYAYEADLTAIK